jgi:hypothetical protein
MTDNSPTSGHRHTVIILLRVPDYPEPVRVFKLFPEVRALVTLPCLKKD